MPKAGSRKGSQVKLEECCLTCGNRLPGGNPLTSFLAKKCRCEVRLTERENANFESEQFDYSKVDLGEEYTVLSKIGVGGHATVYKVHDQALNKTLAIKVLNEELALDQTARQRFEQEARAARDLTHPNMVAVYRSGLTPKDAPYLVMDCLDGETLEGVLKKGGKLEPRRALDIFIQIADGLIHMHMKGIVHRDLKPSNVFITTGENQVEHVKIVDFGIAKQESCDSTQFTRMGEVLGSPPYMSPEQCQGMEVDLRADVYSLGCLMFETLTERSPFDKGTPVKTVLSHINDPIPYLRSFSKDPELEPFEAIVRQCLVKNPKNRYQNVDAVRADLTALRDTGKLAKLPCEVLPPTWKRFGASIVDGVIVSAIAIVILLAVAHMLHVDARVSLSNPFTPLLVLLASIFFGPGFAVFFTSNICSVDTWLLLKIGEFILGSFLFAGYCIGFDQSALKGTPGKILFGLSVVNANGGRISLKQSVVRYLSKICLYTSTYSECLTRALPIRNQNISYIVVSHWKEWTRLLKLTPTDCFSGTFVVNRQALNNPFVPNLKEHFTLPEAPVLALHVTKKVSIVFTWMLLVMLPIFVYCASPPGVKQTPCEFWAVWCTVFNCILIASGFFLTLRNYDQRIKRILADRRKSAASIMDVRNQSIETL